MLQRLTSADAAESARRQISELLATQAEWFFNQTDGHAQALRREEVDLAVSQRGLILCCWTEKGMRSWKITAWNWTGEKLVLRTSRRMGAERSVVELIPRASASAITAKIRAARESRCEQLARLAAFLEPGAKVERMALSPGVRRGQPGRYARIVLRLKHQRVAVTATVASFSASDIDSFLSAALLWFARASEGARPPYIKKLWLIVEKDSIKSTAQRIVLLREALRNTIELYEIDEGWTQLVQVPCPERSWLWKRRLSRFPPVPESLTSEWARVISASAPHAIDVVRACQGETVRYFGLPFARVRKVMDSERVWFGVEGSNRCLLDESTEREWTSLLSDLAEHRSASASDHQHALYRSASEAWLESLLRRDITKLDPGLIIAPLHAQFRTARGRRLGVRPVDLLALRSDGRLVVIELKVFEAREHVLQGTDYWQRVEAHRRRGHIWQAKLFGERVIKNEPPLAYLVAPLLRFHRSFQTLARSIARDIEIYRFDINEDWRAGVKVMRRMRAN